MSAQVETMAWAKSGGLPWHGLGVEVGDDMTPQQIMAAAKLDWTVSKRPMFFEQLKGGGQAKHLVDEHHALVRDSDNKLLDVVGSRYQPTQNAEAFDFFDKFVKECKLKMCTAGALCGGQYVWALAQLEKTFNVASNDQLAAYLLLLSPHKLGKSLIAKGTGVRVVCKNTLDVALQGGEAAFRMSHARKFDEHAKAEAAKVLGLVTNAFNNYGEQGKFLANRKAKMADVKEYFAAVFNMDDETLEGTPKKNGLLEKLLSAYGGNSPGANLATAKGTWWGSFNAVTFVLDHNSGRDQETNLKNNWLGWRGDTKRQALELAMKMAA